MDRGKCRINAGLTLNNELSNEWRRAPKRFVSKCFGVFLAPFGRFDYGKAVVIRPGVSWVIAGSYELAQCTGKSHFR